VRPELHRDPVYGDVVLGQVQEEVSAEVRCDDRPNARPVRNEPVHQRHERNQEMNPSPTARGKQPAGARPGFCPDASAQNFVGTTVATSAFTTATEGLTIREHFALHILNGLLSAQGPAFAVMLGDPGALSQLLELHMDAARTAVVLADDLLVQLATTAEDAAKYASGFPQGSNRQGGTS
jgi:hypothetical protein